MIGSARRHTTTAVFRFAHLRQGTPSGFQGVISLRGISSLLQPGPCASFRPMIPAMINPTETSRQALAESP